MSAVLLLLPPPAADFEGPDLFFQQQVTVAIHTGVASVLGVQGNAQFKSMKTNYPKEGFPFVTWWESVAKLKSLDQWRKKVVNLGSEESAVQDLDKGGVGVYIYRRLTADGEISEEPLQPAPPAA